MQEIRGGGGLPDIPQDSPLGLMIRYWDSSPSRKGKSKEKLVYYCMEVWGRKQIRKDLYWPIHGSLEDWICQQLNIYVNNKRPFNKEESEYAFLWILGTAQAANLFPLKEKKNDKKKRWDVDEPPASPPPYVPPPQGPEQDLPPTAPTEPGEEAPPSNQRITRSQTRERREENLLYPLRETAMGGPQPGVGFVSVPLSSGDVREFKKEMGHLLEDPLGVAERFDQFLGPNIYTWDEMESILKILFTNEERGMIRTAGMRHWDQRHQHGPAGDVKWPLQRPNWDNQDPAHRNNMIDLRDMIIQGIRDSVPRGQNINKAFNEQQKKDETPTEWLERLRKSLQLYSGLDPDSQVGQALLKTQFVAKSWTDIRRKLEKVEDWQGRGLDELLREAQKVYVRREEENQKKQARILMAAVREGQNQGRRGESPRKGPVEPRRRRFSSQDIECFYCRKKGHLQRNCRKRRQDEEIFKED